MTIEEVQGTQQKAKTTETVYNRRKIVYWFAVVLTIELTRRTTGIIIPLLTIFFISYVLFLGNRISGQFHFCGMYLSRFCHSEFISESTF